MDDLSPLGPLALGLLAWALGLAALMTRRTGLCAPSLGCCAAALVLGPLALNAAAWRRPRDMVGAIDKWRRKRLSR